MFAGIKILLLVLVMQSPLPKEEAKLQKKLGDEYVVPKQVIMVQNIEEAALRVRGILVQNESNSKDAADWEPHLILLDLGANRIQEVAVPQVQFTMPQQGQKLETNAPKSAK